MSKKDNDMDDRDKLIIENSEYYTEVPESYKNRKLYTPVNRKEVLAMIPGTILDIFVKEGQELQVGDQVMILEAMKMRNMVASSFPGIVKSIKVKSGDMVRKDQLLVEFE